jgi:O-methyltransferase
MRAAVGARQRMLDAVDAGEPAEVALADLVFGIQRTKLAGALVSSGLADALGRDSRSPAELAAELGLDPAVTSRVVNAAVASRLMRLDDDGRASLTNIGAPLCRDHPRSIASWVAFLSHPATAAGYAHYDTQLREGPEPSGYKHAFGKTMWEYFAEHPDLGATFADAMRQMTAFDIAGMVRAYPWPRRGVICDVAGGVGHLLAAILDRRPRARGILLETRDVVEQADGFLRDRGMADRIDCRVGDLFGEFDAKADVYTMKWIMHDWGDDACRDILRRLRKAMPSGSKVVTIDAHHDRHRPDGFTPMLDALMLVCCEGGRERSPQEMHALMRDAGLNPGRVRHAGMMMLVEGVAP